MHDGAGKTSYDMGRVEVFNDICGKDSVGHLSLGEVMTNPTCSMHFRYSWLGSATDYAFNAEKRQVVLQPSACFAVHCQICSATNPSMLSNSRAHC